MATIRPKPAERRVFREDIRDRLIDDILTGRLPQGARIVETRLAQRFGVSQAPVREALRDLALFGFVVSSPFRGTEVRKISMQDLVEIYPIRAALEGVAARAAARIGDQRAHVNADFAFHHAIVKASGNRMLEQVWQSLRLATTTGVTHSMSQMTHRSLQDIGERHVPVLAALRARDPQRAEAAMCAHIEEPGKWIVNALDRKLRQRSAEQDRAAAG